MRVNVLDLSLREKNGPLCGGAKPVKTLLHNFTSIPIVTPCVVITPKAQVMEVVIKEGVSEGVNVRLGSWGSSNFLTVVENFVKVPSHQPREVHMCPQVGYHLSPYDVFVGSPASHIPP